MRVKLFVSLITASGLLAALHAAPVHAIDPGYVCESFQHKFEDELVLPANGLPIQCTLAAKVHVDPKDSCQSTICVSLHAYNLFAVVGPPLEVEVVSTCIDNGIDGTGLPEIGGAAGPGAPPGETSVCLAGAGLGSTVVTAPEGPNGPLFGEAEGKIKIKCDDGVAKTKGDFEYRCSGAPD